MQWKRVVKQSKNRSLNIYDRFPISIDANDNLYSSIIIVQ